MPAVSVAATPGALAEACSSDATGRRSAPGVWNRGFVGLSLDTIGTPRGMEPPKGHAPNGPISKIRETGLRCGRKRALACRLRMAGRDGAMCPNMTQEAGMPTGSDQDQVPTGHAPDGLTPAAPAGGGQALVPVHSVDSIVRRA